MKHDAREEAKRLIFDGLKSLTLGTLECIVEEAVARRRVQQKPKTDAYEAVTHILLSRIAEGNEGIMIVSGTPGTVYMQGETHTLEHSGDGYNIAVVRRQHQNHRDATDIDGLLYIHEIPIIVESTIERNKRSHQRNRQLELLRPFFQVEPMYMCIYFRDYLEFEDRKKGIYVRLPLQSTIARALVMSDSG